MLSHRKGLKNIKIMQTILPDYCEINLEMINKK